jgi:DNA-binding CsgD family transcriptional regulator
MDEHWSAELVGLRAVLDLLLGRTDAALATASPHLAAARGRHFVEAATAAGPSLVMVGRHLDALALSERAYEERLALGEQPVLIGPGLHLLVQSLAAAEAGALRMADELATLVTTTASSIGSVEGQMWGGVIGGRGFLNQGRFDDARQQFDLAAGAAIDLNLVLLLGWAGGGSLLAAAQSGDAPGVRRCLDALDSLPPTELRLMAGELERARGWAAVTLGDVRRGVDCFVRAADTAADAKQPGLEVIALHDLVRIGMNGHAVRLSEVAARVQGDLAAARRSHADAVLADDHAMFADVASHFEAIGAVVFAAEAANHGAWVARRNGRAGAAEELRTRVLRLRAMRPEAATPGLAGHAGFALLTVREREVIEMAAAGESSKSIAARLEVSVRTVDNLLQRAYRKLGVRGRDDLRGLHLA